MLGTTGGLKAAAKRTAFGDLSNTSNNVRPSKDDSALPGKEGVGIGQKLHTTLQDKSILTLSRPAQRPISLAIVKNASNNAVTSTESTAAAITKPTSAENTLQPSNVRKITSKRSTAVFKDTTNISNEKTSLEANKENIKAAPILPLAPVIEARNEAPCVPEVGAAERLLRTFEVPEEVCRYFIIVNPASHLT